MKVELSLHASNLKNTSGLGTSDPYAVVTHISTQLGMKPQVLGKTEILNNTLNPNWVSVFTIDYELGTPLKLMVQVYDQVNAETNKPMAAASFDIAECLGARGNTTAKEMKNGGTIFAHVAKKQGCGMLALQMKGIKLTSVEGFMRKSDPFFELSCKRDAPGSLTWDNIYRSEVIHDNLNPNWKVANVDLSSLCQGDVNKPILVSVFDFESSGSHVPMGQFETTVKTLISGATSETAFVLQQMGNNVGNLQVTKAEILGVVEPLTAGMQAAQLTQAPPLSQATFVDYVSGGCEFNVTIAIDFTGSNGDPRQPNSLHYLHEDGQLNDYEKAIKAIVEILAKYDSDQMFPVLGFGADERGVVSHCFQCGPSAEVHGVDGILDAYHQTIRKPGLTLSGPTVMTEVIKTAAARSKNLQQAAISAGKQTYGILLILSDGAVTDVRQTANVIGQSADAPFSIVIVGVGNADFSAMKFLDDHSHPPGGRDIAQFVPFNQHCRSSVDLTSETLHEIPAQLTSYFQRNGIPPLAPIIRSDDDIVVVVEDEEIDLTLNFGDDGDIVVASGGVSNTLDCFVGGDVCA